MVRACYEDKEFIVGILVQSFYDNRSVNYIIKQDKKKDERIRKLMKYSFDLCYYFGDVFFSENKMGCALILFPEQRKNSIKAIFLDIQFIFSCMDIRHFKKAIARESKVKALQSNGLKSYLWFIGVAPLQQGRGIGSLLLNDVLDFLQKKNQPVLLETSNVQNVRWYEHSGFKIYNKLDLGYELYFMKKE